MVFFMVMASTQFSLWKADVASAFRMCAYKPEHWEWTAVIYLLHGVPQVTVHQRMCSGGVASVYA